MAQERAAFKKTKVRASIVKLALTKLLLAMKKLDNRQSLEQLVYVSSRLSPESFEGFEDFDDSGEGAVLLRFIRFTRFSDWQLDQHQFLILEDQ